jgi:predicted Fe-S protein YdhL (DUF1289 family)
MNLQPIDPDAFYVCAGICRTDPDSGDCIGCGRPSESVAQPLSPVREAGGSASVVKRVAEKEGHVVAL